MEQKVIDFLKLKQGYVSGEELSHHLKISRQALWKHIQELKEKGYDIAAVPHLGYRLISSPDRLFPSEINYGLRTKFIGAKAYYFDSVSSTMDIAMEMGINNAPEGTIILAETQTKGRGRLGRVWFSPKHKGIYLSLILRPKLLPNLTPVLTLLAGVSICEAVKEITALDARIKWPNDILIHNKKLGGILTELNAEMDATRFVIVGIGLNVNNSAKALVYGATSLRNEKKENISRVEVLQEILRRIEENYLSFQEKGAQPIIEKWRNYNITLHRRVRISCQNKHLEGTAVNIDTDGALLVRKDSGLIERITAGDVVHCR